jgi:methylamine--corrinoid protein Co-methyltransferase
MAIMLLLNMFHTIIYRIYPSIWQNLFLNGNNVCDRMVASKPISIFDTYDRFANGKKVREDTWDYVTVPNNATEIKSRYEIEFGRKIIPEDKDEMNRLFEAGVDMLVETGFFNPDLGKVMYVTESEVFEGIKKASKKLRLGRGKDEVVCERRRGNSLAKPIIQGGPTGAPVSEDIFVVMMQGYAQEATVDTLVSGVMSTVDGHAPTANTPWEIKATLAEIRAVREGMARAERPGMAI